MSHTVTVEWEGGYGPHSTFQCKAPDDSLCHAVYDCECGEWGDAGVEDGRPWHAAYDGDSDVRHYGRLDPNECALRDWFENTDDPLDGSLTFEVETEWEGDYYSFVPGQVVDR